MTPFILLVMVRSLICTALLLFTLPGKVSAWVYPEHRLITALAIQQLSPDKRKILENVWTQIRTGHEDRLSASLINPQYGLDTEVLDLASWPAIAGDHSCSPQQMMDIILMSDWILKVDRIAERLRIDLAQADRQDRTLNAIRNSDIRLQRADLDYATRAGANNVHFLLERNAVTETVEEYFKRCLQEGAPLNALVAYAYFHTRALEKVEQSKGPNLTQEQKSAFLLAALANEAFALHFIEDAYAARSCGRYLGFYGRIEG